MKFFYLAPNIPILKVLLVIFLLKGGAAYSQSVENGKNGDTAMESIARKYALKLGVSVDSLEFLDIYNVMDKWSEFVTTNPKKLGHNVDATFAQFMYYLTFNTKLPADVNLLYKDRKTYLFKNLIYLRNGDLMFYGKEEGKPEKVAFYLQNNYVVYPDTNGVLQFQPYEQLQKSFFLTAAKIERDG